MTKLKISGEVQRPSELSIDDLAKIAGDFQIEDVSKFIPNRKGTAVNLEGILQLVDVRGTANFLGLHSSLDNFHASIPLAAVRDRGMLIYQLQGQPLSRKDGGPFRFFIRDHAACKAAEVDECANVKFVDHIELTKERGFDNRPTDEEEHAKLHQHEKQ